MKDIKAALVTGGATGIGKACALSFLEGGYAVAIVGRRKEKIEETEKELADIFGNEKVLAIAADVSSREDVEKIFASIDERRSDRRRNKQCGSSSEPSFFRDILRRVR